MKKKWVSALVLGIIILWVIYLVATGLTLGWQAGGPFGDTFGALNALFSGLAMGGVIVAIFMQRDELILQREELELTRKELTRSAAAQEGQTEALTRQYEILRTTAQINAYNGLSQVFGTRGAERVRELLGQLEDDLSAAS